MLARAASLLLACSALACVRSVPADVDAEPPADTDPSPRTDPSPEPERPARVAPNEATEPLPDCPAEPDPSTYCTAEGKLAGAWRPVDTIRIPVDATVFFVLEGESHDRSRLVVAGLGEVLYLRHETCRACARVMGRGFEGRPAALDDAQRRALQTELGLPADAPLLANVDAWAEYCRGPGQAALAEIARRDRSSQP